MPLSMVRSGLKVKLVGIRGGGRLQYELAELGLSIGSEIKVIHNHNHNNGSFKMNARGSNLVIGHGMAMKIEVQ
jgi:Fe2+ transport system protein FeoA